MKGAKVMNDYVDEGQENFDETLKIENLFSEIRTVDNKDRTKYLIDACNNDLKELMIAISKYNKSGKMTINLLFDVGKGESNELNIIAEIDIKKPKGKISHNAFYHDNKGNIYLDDPNLTNSSKVAELKR